MNNGGQIQAFPVPELWLKRKKRAHSAFLATAVAALGLTGAAYVAPVIPGAMHSESATVAAVGLVGADYSPAGVIPGALHSAGATVAAVGLVGAVNFSVVIHGPATAENATATALGLTGAEYVSSP